MEGGRNGGLQGVSKACSGGLAGRGPPALDIFRRHALELLGEVVLLLLPEDLGLHIGRRHSCCSGWLAAAMGRYLLASPITDLRLHPGTAGLLECGTRGPLLVEPAVGKEDREKGE